MVDIPQQLALKDLLDVLIELDSTCPDCLDDDDDSPDIADHTD